MTSIAELRAKKNKMSQRELAEKIGVTQATISKWEKNPLGMDGRYIVKLCVYFKVSSDELLGIEQKTKV